MEVQQQISDGGSGVPVSVSEAFAPLDSGSAFYNLACSATDAMICGDEKDRIAFWNPAAERIFGYSTEEMLGQPIAVLIPDRHKTAHKVGVERYLNTGQPSIIGRSVEVSALNKDGQEFPIELSISAWKSDGRQFFSAIIRDITRRKFMEQALHRAREDAEKASRAKSRFLSATSHELRTPLNAIMGFGGLLLNNPGELLSERQKVHAGHIVSAGEHLLALINDLLDLGKIESGKIEFADETIDLSPLISECLEYLLQAADQRGITISVQLPEAPFSARADRMRLRQVLVNLLSNAVKYNVDNGTIEVIGQPATETSLKIGVRDTGGGIAPQDMERLFEPFQRLVTPASTIEGTGLGLSLTKALVEGMGGSLSVESRLGEGSTFWLNIPAG